MFRNLISRKISLCHRPSNWNLSKLCGLYKSLAPEVVSWFLDSASRNLLHLRRKARCARLSPPADSRAFDARYFLGQLPRIESLSKTKQDGKRSGLPLPSYVYINFSPLYTAIFSWKNHKITQRKIQTWVGPLPFRQKCQDKTFFFKSKNYFIK